MQTIHLAKVKTDDEIKREKMMEEYQKLLQTHSSEPITNSTPKIPKTVDIQGYQVSTILLGIVLFFILLIFI